MMCGWTMVTGQRSRLPVEPSNAGALRHRGLATVLAFVPSPALFLDLNNIE